MAADRICLPAECSDHAYFVAFSYCLVKDRDALRSETYSLHKIAIEHGLVGDSITGVIAPETEDHRLLVQHKTETEQ